MESLDFQHFREFIKVHEFSKNKSKFYFFFKYILNSKFPKKKNKNKQMLSFTFLFRIIPLKLSFIINNIHIFNNFCDFSIRLVFIKIACIVFIIIVFGYLLNFLSFLNCLHLVENIIWIAFLNRINNLLILFFFFLLFFLIIS